jgi:ABC-type multidrug transport system fused ATPase/permease subunit
MISFPLADPGRPDTRSTTAFMWWVARAQWRTILPGVACGVTWMVALALVPAALGRGIDRGIVAGDLAQLTWWSLAVVGLAVVIAAAGAARHWFAVHNWLTATYRAAQLVDDAVVDRGTAVTRTLPAGEVVAVFANDVIRFGALYDVAARFVGAIVSYIAVALILLSTAPRIGLVVLLGAPVLLAGLSVIVRPLQARQAQQREEAGRLTTLGADTVAGLRVLRGIGGEQTYLRRYTAQSQAVRRTGVRVAGIQAALDSSQVLAPGLFATAVVWLGARAVITGDLTPGELVAFYGYATFLAMPLRTITEGVDRGIRARIAARKILRVLAVVSDHEPTVGTSPDTSANTQELGECTSGSAATAREDDLVLVGASPGPSAGRERPGDRPSRSRTADGAAEGSLTGTLGQPGLVDCSSGAVLRAGRMTAVVSARPEESAALADRLGRLGPGPHDVLLDGVPVDVLPLAEVRRRVVVSETDPRLFTGPLRRGLHPCATEADILEAITVASADDVLEALPDGLDASVEERGRSFSGGQRQRLALTRVLLTGAEVLVLVEPTSSVDAHTEARIADRLARHRRGRTTVIVTASPLVLDHADEVLLLEEGRVTAAGRHRDLLDHAAYRRIVHRGEES